MDLFCRHCDGLNVIDRNWVSPTDECQFCGAINQWRTINDPKKPYDLSENDKRFLRSLKIGTA